MISPSINAPRPDRIPVAMDTRPDDGVDSVEYLKVRDKQWRLWDVEQISRRPAEVVRLRQERRSLKIGHRIRHNDTTPTRTRRRCWCHAVTIGSRSVTSHHWQGFIVPML